ncbi:MAG: hypothetical protein LC776_14670 [Acidobacteria bacterium]|nr:hypothetical protein [Acidobacteriota bacterium]
MGALPFPAGVVAVAGSRRLSPEASALVAQVARELVASRCSLVVGCCVGADAVALVSVPGAPGRAVRVLCAWGPGGAGAGPASAVGPVLAAARAGVQVAWWAGGGPSVPLVARLARRTRAVIAEASAALVVFPASSVVAGSGSWLAAAAAVERGLQVVVFPFPVRFSAAELPALGVGRWVATAGAGVWDSAWQWVPGQLVLSV